MGTDTLNLGIVMDPIESITPYKDSSFAMLLEAERRGAEIHYFCQHDDLDIPSPHLTHHSMYL